MRVVITGAAGFIGSRFAEVLLENAERLDFDDIVLLDALTYSVDERTWTKCCATRASVSLKDRSRTPISPLSAVLGARRRALSGGEPRRPFDHRCASVLRHERHRHAPTARRRAPQ